MSKNIVLSDLMTSADITEQGFLKGIQATSGQNIDEPGTPNVDVLKSGTQATLIFNNLKGNQGVQGSQGIMGNQGSQGTQGSKGTDGVSPTLPTFAATAVINNTTTTPSCAVSITDNKNFKFTFDGIKGMQGSNGSQGLLGKQGVVGSQGVPGPNDLTDYAKKPNNETITGSWVFNKGIQCNGYSVFPAGAGETSDIRFKTNIEPIKNVLKDVLDIDVFSYTWNRENDPQRETFGVSADQILSMGEPFSKLVHIDNDIYKTKTVEYNKLGVLAIKAIQEQQKVIESLTKRIEKLEKKK